MFENPSSLPAAPLPQTPGVPPQKPVSAVPPANLPTGQASAPVDDMFDAVEPVKTAPMPSLNTSMPGASLAVDPPMVTNRKTIVVASLILGVLLLVGGGVALARFLGKPILGMTSGFKSSTNTPAVTTPDPATTPVITESPFDRLREKSTADTATTDTNAVVPPTETVAPKDTDSDGLNDDEETILGTDILGADSDKDGLSDYDEVRVYRTDAMNVDTDGDTFKDGDEVKNGYNPAGAGKLFGVPPATNSGVMPKTSLPITPPSTTP
jgi:hypothetical protein